MHDLENELPLTERHIHGLLELVDAFEQHEVRYALIGGMAVGFHSRPRATRDIVCVVHIPALTLPNLHHDLASHGFTFDTNKVIAEWTEHHITQLQYYGIRIAWVKPVIPCYQHAIDTAQPRDLFEKITHIATPEYLIVTKLLAFRTQDQADIQALLIANCGKLDIDLIRHEVAFLADLEDDRLEQFEKMVATYYRESPNSAADP